MSAEEPLPKPPSDDPPATGPIPPAAPEPPLPRWLVWATLGYLTLPLFLFFGGWLKPIYAMVVIACTARAAIDLGRIPGRPQGAGRCFPRFWQGAVFLSVIAAAVTMHGPGGFGIQTWDWVKHNAVLKDLVDGSWPVTYQTPQGNPALVYYIAYYLPAALVGKLVHWTAANIAILLWTIAGCGLAGTWLMVLSRAPWWLALGLFLLFSGWDLPGDALRREAWGPHGWVNNFDAEWWAAFWTLPANLSLIAFAPHQAIAGWLLASLLIAWLKREPDAVPFGSILTFGLLWSPFVTVGLAALSALWLALNGPRILPAVRSHCRWPRLSALPALLVLLAYFLARAAPLELPPALVPSRRVIAFGTFRFGPEYHSVERFVPAYLLSTLLEFGIVAALLFLLFDRTRRFDRGILTAATAVLLALPFLHYGRFNDLVMRSCIPCLWAIQILCLEALSDRTARIRRPRLWTALAVALAIGALYPLNMLRITTRNLSERSWHLVFIPIPEQVPDLFRQQRRTKKLLYSLAQYLGSQQTWFFRTLARDTPDPLLPDLPPEAPPS